jgi:hypothetical protein
MAQKNITMPVMDDVIKYVSEYLSGGECKNKILNQLVSVDTKVLGEVLKRSASQDQNIDTLNRMQIIDQLIKNSLTVLNEIKGNKELQQSSKFKFSSAASSFFSHFRTPANDRKIEEEINEKQRRKSIST